MNLKYLLVPALLLTITTAYSQKNDELAKMKKAWSSTADKSAGDTSQNSYDKNITDAFIGFGFVVGKSNKGAQVNYGESREFIVGLGGGRRFVKWNGIGGDLYYKSTGFFLAQDSTKILPNNNLHSSEKVSFDNFGGLVYDRFYFGTIFFDGGFYYDWTFYTKHITWDTFSFSYGKVTKTLEKQLNFTNSTNYGLTFRLGSTKGVAFYFNYRLSKVFKTSPQGINYPELPPYVIGITVRGQ